MRQRPSLSGGGGDSVRAGADPALLFFSKMRQRRKAAQIRMQKDVRPVNDLKHDSEEEIIDAVKRA